MQNYLSTSVPTILVNLPFFPLAKENFNEFGLHIPKYIPSFQTTTSEMTMGEMMFVSKSLTNDMKRVQLFSLLCIFVLVITYFVTISRTENKVYFTFIVVFFCLLIFEIRARILKNF